MDMASTSTFSPDIFNCFICLHPLKDARMCIHCSKLSCFSCLEKWLKKRPMKCPHCSVRAKTKDFVRCRWWEEMTEGINGMVEKLRRSTEEEQRMKLKRKWSEESNLRCKNHRKEIEFFCEDCQLTMCSRTALMSDDHKNHKFSTIEDAHKEQIVKVEEQLAVLRERKGAIATEIEMVGTKIETTRTAKNECAQRLIDKLDSILQTKVDYFNDHQSYLKKESTSIESTVVELQSLIESSSPLECVQKFPELYGKSLGLKTVNDLKMVPVMTDFSEEIRSDYYSGKYVLRNFSDLQRKNAPVRSPPLHVNGLEFCLRVHPNGEKGEASGKWLSVHLSLYPGQTDLDYDYRIEMVQQNDGKKEKPTYKNICTGVFQSNGYAWGYSKFYPLDSLAKDGFLDCKTDTLIFNFQGGGELQRNLKP